MKRRVGNSEKLGGNGEEERAGQVDSDQNMKQGFERRLVNEFILDYYRSKWPLKETLFSVFPWHNETLNIWTHLGGFIIFVALTMLSSLEKTNIESMIMSFFRPVDNDDDGDDNEDRCQWLRFFFPGAMQRKKVATMCIDFPRSIPQLDRNYSGAKQEGYDDIPKEISDPDAKK
ncbi:unnamed protein product [Camellia sinensis]